MLKILENYRTTNILKVYKLGRNFAEKLETNDKLFKI